MEAQVLVAFAVVVAVAQRAVAVEVAVTAAAADLRLFPLALIPFVARSTSKTAAYAVAVPALVHSLLVLNPFELCSGKAAAALCHYIRALIPVEAF
jgi:hypothetical protein